MTTATLDTLPTAPTAAANGVTTLLRLEGAVLMAASVAAYVHLGGSWGLFLALILVPDLSLLGYLGGPRAGAASYNAMHSSIGPAVLAALALVLGAQTALLVATIWLAHVGMDRAAGYGLKRASGFRDTHLGRIGGFGAR